MGVDMSFDSAHSAQGAVAVASGRHFPSGHFTDVTGGQGGPSRHQCGGCGKPISHVRGEWRNVWTWSMWCPEGAR